MTQTYRFSSLVSVCLCLLASSAFGQDGPEMQDASDLQGLRWRVSVGLNRYQEPDLMQLQGPEIGVHAMWTRPSIQWEGDVLLGQQKYTSRNSGHMAGITNLETRWRGLVSLADVMPTSPNFLTGLAIHTLWNDLRGTTTFNQITYGGYERSAVQLWLPMRWSQAGVWDVEAGLLIYGRHISKLSQVNSHYTDLVNTQHTGQYVQATFDWAWNNGDTLKPLIRYTHLSKSNSVVMNGSTWVEPASQRWQIGVIWEFNPH
jgi:hypothetical protein